MLGGQDKGIAAAVGDAVLLTDSVSAARGSLPASAGSVEGEFGGEKITARRHLSNSLVVTLDDEVGCKGIAKAERSARLEAGDSAVSQGGDLAVGQCQHCQRGEGCNLHVGRRPRGSGR